MRIVVLRAACIVFAPAVSGATTIRVPADQPTIPAALDAATAGDTILVADGTYMRHSIRMKSGVVLRSESGDPSRCTLDANRVSTVFICRDLDATTAIEGFTVTGGEPGFHGAAMYGFDAHLRIADCVFTGNRTAQWGGAIAFQGTSSPTIERCRFEGNLAGSAGALYMERGEATIVDCVFVDNRAHIVGGAVVSWALGTPLFSGCLFAGNVAEGNGGAISCNTSFPTLRNCTLYGNEAYGLGGSVHVKQSAHVTIDHSIIAFTRNAESVFCSSTSGATVTCSVLYKNIEGDWSECIEDQYGVNGNFTADPRFCDRLGGDYGLEVGSPCAAGATTCGLIGAYGVACGVISLEPTSLAGVKARYLSPPR